MTWSGRRRARRAALAGVALAVAALASQGGAWAHAFLSRSEPRMGATLGASPAAVRVWFDGPIEPVFSTLRVDDAQGRRVDNGDGRVGGGDRTLLEVSLSPLRPGRYRVVWSVIARDAHRKEGDFTFRVK